MQPAKIVRYGAFGLLALVTIAWLGMLPFALLAIGFSGGELLSPSALFVDVLAGDLYWSTRVWAWFALIWPVALVVAFRRWRRTS